MLDLDDTLMLERDYVQSGFDAVDAYARSIGIVGLGAACRSRFESGVRRTVFNEALADLGAVDDGLVQRLVQEYRAHRPRVTLLPDVPAALDRLAAEGLATALLTGGPVASQRQKVAALDLARRMAPIVYAGMWGPSYDKPHERGFEEIERYTGLSGSRLLYVGDNPEKDLLPARTRKWQVVRIHRAGALTHHPPLPGVPDIPDLTRLPALLGLGKAGPHQPE